MRNPRIYQAVSTGPGKTINLDEYAVRHLVQVLRLQTGDRFILFNGQGRAWQARLESADRRHATASIQQDLTSDVESPLSIHLGLGISKGERMDYAIQKAVELGVTEITPLFTRYSMVRLDAGRKDKRRQRWQDISIGACEQCGRNRLPVLHPAISNHDWLDTVEAGQKLLFDPLATQSLSDIVHNPASTCLYIGPEGGLSNEEIHTAKQAGFTGLRLGPRVLRTETAVVAALTAVQMVWGDLL